VAVPVGLGAAVVGAGVVGAELAVRVAVGGAAVSATVGTALGLDRGRTTRSGPQAATTTRAMETTRAP